MALKNTLFYFIFIHNIISGLWIRIRMDSHSFSLLDPDPGGKNLKKKRTNERKLVVIVGKFRSAPYQLFFFLVLKTGLIWQNYLDWIRNPVECCTAV